MNRVTALRLGALLMLGGHLLLDVLANRAEAHELQLEEVAGLDLREESADSPCPCGGAGPCQCLNGKTWHVGHCLICGEQDCTCEDLPIFDEAEQRLVQPARGVNTVLLTAGLAGNR